LDYGHDSCQRALGFLLLLDWGMNTVKELSRHTEPTQPHPLVFFGPWTVWGQMSFVLLVVTNWWIRAVETLMPCFIASETSLLLLLDVAMKQLDCFQMQLITKLIN
jgi:hypothetical protein